MSATPIGQKPNEVTEFAKQFDKHVGDDPSKSRLYDSSTFNDRENLGVAAGISRPNSGKTVALYNDGFLEMENERLSGLIDEYKEILAAQTKTHNETNLLVLQKNSELKRLNERKNHELARLRIANQTLQNQLDQLRNNNGGETEETEETKNEE